VRASNWLERNLQFGNDWGNGFRESPELRVGGYCYVPGKIDEPRVVLEVSGNVVGFWDYDRVRRFARNRVLGAMPIPTNPVPSDRTKATTMPVVAL
jgi:hypothetical protein